MTATDMRFLDHDDAAGEADARRRARASARRHTVLVKALRILLPLGGAAIVATIFGTAIVKSFIPVESIGAINMTSDGLEMNDPNLAGRLKGGRTYHVSAAKAVQSFSDTSRIALTDLVATLKESETQNVTVNSKSGLFDTNDEWLTLSDGIVLTTTDGYRADLESARLDFKSGTMVSDAPVAIKSEKFDLTANSLSIEDDGNLVRFVGSVRLTLYQGLDSDR